MSGLLKDLYSKNFYKVFCVTLENVVPSFNKKKFIANIFDEQWEQKELKERMKHTSFILHQHFPADFKKASHLILKSISHLQQRGVHGNSLEYMFLPDYIETYGINDLQTSMQTFEQITSFTSCEFAVRPFIIRYGKDMIDQMFQWSLHKNEHVRRLASEGSRPRLPWAMAIPSLKNNPAPLLPLLDSLKNDPSEYVRRSVANNLNDISKDHPDLLLKVAKQWKGISAETDALIKHASRTLLKSGHPSILKFYGLDKIEHLHVDAFKILTPRCAIGQNLEFTFSLTNIGDKKIPVRIEYGIHYLRINNTHSKKVFKISERQLMPNEKIDIKRNQSFKIITTRKFYTGTQHLSIIINGQERKISKFILD